MGYPLGLSSRDRRIHLWIGSLLRSTLAELDILGPKMVLNVPAGHPGPEGLLILKQSRLVREVNSWKRIGLVHPLRQLVVSSSECRKRFPFSSPSRLMMRANA